MERILSKKFRLTHERIASAMEPIKAAVRQVNDHNLKGTDIRRELSQSQRYLIYRGKERLKKDGISIEPAAKFLLGLK